MPDTTHNALAAAVRAMTEVVIPAVDPDHPLAREQARLVAGFLSLLDARLDHLAERDRFELRFLVRQAKALLEPAGSVSPAIADELRTLIDRGAVLLANPDTTTGAIHVLAGDLAAVTTAAVRAAADGDPAPRAQVEHVVVEMSQTWLDVQRAWFAPQGWEPDASLPTLDEALRR